MFARRPDPITVLSALGDGAATVDTLALRLEIQPNEVHAALRWGGESGLLCPVAPATQPPAYTVTPRGRAFLAARQRLAEAFEHVSPDGGRIGATQLVDAYAEWADKRAPLPAEPVRTAVRVIQRVRLGLATLAVVALLGGLAVSLAR